MVTSEDVERAEWRRRLADALRECLMDADRLAARAETMELEERVRALEEEGRLRGFRPAAPSSQ